MGEEGGTKPAWNSGTFALLLGWQAGKEQDVLTDVGVLQQAADPGFSFQLLVI